MRELLAPAGNMEALKAAISNGCDAVYFGMQKFGARAYSTNFDFDTLKEAVAYAHLRDVKVYVTMNTIVYEEEMEAMKAQLHELNEAGVDGVIAQDLAVFQYIVDHFEDLEAHCSTQMGIDDLEGTMLLKEAGAKRVVLSREVPIEKVNEIREKADIPIEIFVHGALCVSYSGNCLMSGLTGYRSGNRGRCVGSCRKEYELIDTRNQKSIGKGYLISTKDLNTIDYIDQYQKIDSLKIEGRMKESVYVANVISHYRAALDGNLKPAEKDNLKKTFNRTFTKGYLFHEDPRDISNINRSNNFGYEIGKVIGRTKGMYELRLKEELRQNDIVRIDHQGEDVILSLVKLYDADEKLISHAQKQCFIKAKEKLSAGDIVYMTKDYQYHKQLENMLEHEFRRFPLDLQIYAYPQCPLIVEANAWDVTYYYQSEEVLAEAIQSPTSRESVIRQFSKLHDSVFEPGNISFEENNAFIPVKMLNQARRAVIQGLYEAKLNQKPRRCKEAPEYNTINHPVRRPYLSAVVTTKEQYEAAQAEGIQEIYYDQNIIRRNQNTYEEKNGQLLIGGYGGIYHYRNTNPFISDYSLNVVNAASVYAMHQLGAKRVTLSYELNKKHIQDLIAAYQRDYQGHPALELIVYGRAPLLFTKYCPMRKMNQCGSCKNKSYALRDGNDYFPILSHADCTTTILNGKTLNLLDEINQLQGIEAFSLHFTTETAEETRNIIALAKQKLMGDDTECFNQNTDTRGYFNKEIV